MPTNYITGKKNGVDIVLKESSTYPGDFSEPVSGLPSGAVPIRIGTRNHAPYAREAKSVFNPVQFGQDDYYDPAYSMAIDFNGNILSASDLKRLGMNTFTNHVITEDEFNALPQINKERYQYEGELHGNFEGRLYYESTLAQLEAHYNGSIVSGMQHWCANIETSTEWHRWMYEEGFKSYDSWDAAKGRSIVCELDGQTRTLEQLDASGLWDAEAKRRRSNRNAIMMLIARSRNAFCAYGSSMHQGEPRTNSLSDTSVFVDGSADVSAIGGSNGTIVLNGRTYNGVSKNVYAYENSHLDYYYYGGALIPNALRQQVWVQKQSGTQTMEYVWANMPGFHITAGEKGHWQANRRKMENIAGQSVRGQRRMFEFNYEFDLFDENFNAFPAFVPFVELQNISFGQYSVTKKLFLPPIWIHGICSVNRFLEGATPGAGIRCFNDPDKARLPLTHPWWNHVMHSITAIWQARKDMQPRERFLGTSTLVEDMSVQVGQSGSYSQISGAEAFAFGPDGSRGTQKSTWSGRWQSVTGGYRVTLMGGFNQAPTSEHTDNVKFPNGECNGAVFTCKLRGYGVHFYDFFVPSGDSNQTYTASFAATSFEQPGYAGRIQS